MIAHLISILNRWLPETRLAPEDGTMVLSIEDIHRYRLSVICVFGFLITLAYTGLQIAYLGFERTGQLNLITGLVGAGLCLLGLFMALWGKKPEVFIRLMVVCFSAMIWVEIGFSGGVTGYHAVIFPVLPVVAALLLGARDTFYFTALNLVMIFVLLGLSEATTILPAFEVPAHVDTIMTVSMLITAVIGCAGGAFVMAHQNERVEGQLRAMVERQSHLAAHDHLSGLGNRSRLQAYFEEIAEEEHSFDLLLIDLDGFKAINDTYGHNAGDHLIKVVSERLREIADEQDLLIRLGGDEFVIVLKNVEEPLPSVRRYGEYIVDILSRPYNWDGENLRISASIGHARFPEHATTPSKVLSLADKALYSAKDSGKRQCVTIGVSPPRKRNRKTEVREAVRRALG